MLTKFEKGKRYRASRKEFLENEPSTNWELDKGWFEDCLYTDVEVLESDYGKIGIYGILPEWCVEVKEEE